MKAKSFFEYCKQQPYYLLMFIVALFISVHTDEHIEGLVMLLVNFAIQYYKHEAHTEFLHRKGLTAKQYRDQQFIEKWTETHRDGLVRYCLFDGGVITGAILSVCIGGVLLFSKILGDITSGPGAIIAIIWKSYAIGFAIAACLYRRLWVINEKHFNKLSVA